MSIQNTEKIYEEKADLMNAGLRAYSLTIGDKNALADYYGLGVRTVERWFAGPGQQYSRCVPAYTWKTEPFEGDGPGMRIWRMFDANNIGDGKPLSPNKGGTLLNHLRMRCILAATLGVYGGLERIPIYNGVTKEYKPPAKATLKEALHYINTLHIGGINQFMAQAWVSIVLDQEYGPPVKWQVTVRYNAKLGTDGSDDLEEEVPEDYDANQPNDGDIPEDELNSTMPSHWYEPDNE